jgi:hypothetical protein
MANVKIISEPSSVTIVVSPYDKNAFKTFLNLFPTPQSFDVASYNRIRFAIQIARDFTTSPTQKNCFDKFDSAVKDLEQVSYRYMHRFPQPFMHAYKCYGKLRNLIFSNSTIFQHFGIDDPSFSVLPCKNLSMKEFHVCQTHSKSFSRREAIVTGHANMGDDDYCFVIPFDMSEFEVGVLNNDINTMKVIDFIRSFDKTFPQFELKGMRQDLLKYDESKIIESQKMEDVLLALYSEFMKNRK